MSFNTRHQNRHDAKPAFDGVLVPNIVNYIKDLDAFDQELIDIMATAFEQACKIMGAPSLVVREVVASRIIHLTQSGERDVFKLARAAVEAATGRSE